MLLLTYCSVLCEEPCRSTLFFCFFSTVVEVLITVPYIIVIIYYLIFIIYSYFQSDSRDIRFEGYTPAQPSLSITVIISQCQDCFLPVALQLCQVGRVLLSTGFILKD